MYACGRASCTHPSAPVLAPDFSALPAPACRPSGGRGAVGSGDGGGAARPLQRSHGRLAGLPAWRQRGAAPAGTPAPGPLGIVPLQAIPMWMPMWMPPVCLWHWLYRSAMQSRTLCCAVLCRAVCMRTFLFRCAATRRHDHPEAVRAPRRAAGVQGALPTPRGKPASNMRPPPLSHVDGWRREAAGWGTADRQLNVHAICFCVSFPESWLLFI